MVYFLGTAILTTLLFLLGLYLLIFKKWYRSLKTTLLLMILNTGLGLLSFFNIVLIAMGSSGHAPISAQETMAQNISIPVSAVTILASGIVMMVTAILAIRERMKGG